MEIQEVVSPSRSTRVTTDRTLAHRMDEVVPIGDLPAAIGLAIEKGVLPDSLVAIGFSPGADPKVHVLVQPAIDPDATLAFRDGVIYLGGLSPFGEMINSDHLGERIRAARLVGPLGIARIPEVAKTVARALRPMLVSHGPAFMEATRGFLSAPSKGPARWALISGNVVGPITLHREEIEQIHGDQIPCLGWVNGVRAVAVVNDQHLAVINCGRGHTYTPYDRDHRVLSCSPAPRLLRPRWMHDMGDKIQSVSTALWPRKTSGERIPSVWYHLIGTENRTYLVQVSGAPGGHAFKVMGRASCTFQILEVASPGSFVTRDSKTGAVRVIEALPSFDTAEVNKLVRSF